MQVVTAQAGTARSIAHVRISEQRGSVKIQLKNKNIAELAEFFEIYQIPYFWLLAVYL